MKDNYILGIWDGHDSGAALIKGRDIIMAVNEERFTKRKLEMEFPINSIKTITDYAGLKFSQINDIAISTWDFGKTIERVIPRLKEEYYLIRRRKKRPTKNDFIKNKIKYMAKKITSNRILLYLSKYKITKKLEAVGLNESNVHFLDHHQCHAEAAARLSGFSDALVITLDGNGDGLSGSINTFSNGILTKRASIPATCSFGIFFEHVTNILNMRELEDAGKVMALADYAYPIPKQENPILSFFEIRGLEVKAKYPSLRMYNELKKIYWQCPSEQFAFMAQQCIETWVIKLIKNALKAFNHQNICLAGGLFANIKLNMKIRNLKQIKQCFIFPQMGDGGLPLGAALTLNYQLNKIKTYKLNDVFLGTEYPPKEIEDTLKKKRLNYRYTPHPYTIAAELISRGEIIIWFQGRMEYGPRALGNRSILARPDSLKIKEKLNIYLKKRHWYQPFCPSMLVEEAPELLSDYNNIPNQYMTMAYNVKEKYLERLQGVIARDGSCRPQMVKPENNNYYKLLKEVKKQIGIGVILNTSLNIHGFPIACSPDDAIDIFLTTGLNYMIIGDYLVEK